MAFKVPFIRPVFPDSTLLAADFDAIVESNWYTNFGAREREFAHRIAEYVGGGAVAVTMANATIALIAMLHAVLGRGKGTRVVLVPSFTFAAGPQAIEWCGYRPVLIDIEPDGLQPDLGAARAALEGRDDVAAILLGNTFGIGNAAIRDWEALAADAGIPLLIDSAAGFGSTYADGSRIGAAGAAEVFSFHATKPFAIGEGGAITTRDPELAERLNRFQNFGFASTDGAMDLGMNGKLMEIAAAIGLRQLDVLDDAIRSRQDVLARYQDGLPAGWRLPTNIERSSVCFATLVGPAERDRDEALERLKSSGVEARRYCAPAIHRQPHFVGLERVGDLAVTEDIARRVLSLPVHQSMSEDSISAVLDALNGGRG